MIKRKWPWKYKWNVKDYHILWYPNQKSAVQKDMTKIKPKQKPPLMIRKARWRL